MTFGSNDIDSKLECCIVLYCIEAVSLALTAANAYRLYRFYYYAGNIANEHRCPDLPTPILGTLYTGGSHTVPGTKRGRHL
jgi:hypothetical protein